MRDQPVELLARVVMEGVNSAENEEIEKEIEREDTNVADGNEESNETTTNNAEAADVNNNNPVEEVIVKMELMEAAVKTRDEEELKNNSSSNNTNSRENHQEEKWIKHYSSKHKILLVGEGDFSFAVCLAKAFGSATNMVATSLDTRETLLVKYSMARRNLDELEQRGCTILHGVDAHTMNRHPALQHLLFDRIVFNFPHAGFHDSEHKLHQIELHQYLVRGFFRRAKHMLTFCGQVHVTHKTAYPFSAWEVKKLAKDAGLRLLRKEPFYLRSYSGYANKRGGGHLCDASFPVGECSTFMFGLLW